MSRARALCLAAVGALASAVLVAGPAQAATYTLSGVVRDAAGAPVAGIGVDWQAGSSTSLTQTATTTAADGSYQLSVPTGADQESLFIAGSYLGESLYARTESFHMSGDRVENATLPLGATARVTVVDGNGSPVAGATVTSADRFALTPTSGGLSLISRFDKDACTTPASGVCEFVSFRGGSIEYFDVSAPGTTETAHLAGMDTPAPVNDEQLVFAALPVTGVVRAADGEPVPGASVQLVRDGLTLTTTSNAGGQYAFSVLAGDGAVLEITGTVTEGSRSGPFTLTTSPFDISGPRSDVLTLPALATLAIHVEDSQGVPVPGARVARTGSNLSGVTGTTSSGVVFTAAMSPSVGYHPLCSQTADDGVCETTVFQGGSIAGFEVTPPIGSSQDFPGVGIPDDPTSVTAHLTGFASVPSAGTETGRTAAATSYGSHAVITSLTSSTVVLPDGIEPIVGRISYAISVPAGGTTSVALALPVNANALLHVGGDGTIVDITSPGNPSGKQATIAITDGSATDADGVVNGTITGSIVPVVRDPLVIETSTLPGAAEGHAYQTSLTGSGPVPPYTWKVASGALPPGLVLGSDGTISGTPTAVGTFNFDVEMRDSPGSMFVAQRSLTLIVATVAVATTSVPDGYAGDAYSFTLKRAGGGGIASWKLTGGSLPPGMRLSSAGALLGTPTSVGTYSFDVVVASAGRSSPPQRLTIVVRPMEIATSSLPNASVGKWYSQALTTRGGKGTLSWSIVDGSLPTNLRLSSAGRITGTPRTPGTWTFTVRVTDSTVPKQVATRTLSLTVT